MAAPGAATVDSVVTEIRKPQISRSSKPPLVCGLALMRRVPCGASSANSDRRRPLSSKQFRGPVALHPLFEDAHMRRVLVHLAHRHLVRAPVALGAPAVDLLRAGPALWACEARSSASGAAR